jgi:hypothetical protein
VSYAILELDSRIEWCVLSVEVKNLEDTIVLVNTSGIDLVITTEGSNEGVGNHSVTSLEPDARLEGVLTNRTNHL